MSPERTPTMTCGRIFIGMCIEARAWPGGSSLAAAQAPRAPSSHRIPTITVAQLQLPARLLRAADKMSFLIQLDPVLNLFHWPAGSLS
jgi:hypothetical protein